MKRLKLKVPFAERWQAEKLGARYDRDEKVWYVPDNVDFGPFFKWLPLPPGSTAERLPRVVWAPEQEYHVNIITNRYYVSASTQVCERCDRETKVFGILVPPGHRVKEPGVDIWEDLNEFAFLQHILFAPPSVIGRIEAITSEFYYDEGLYEVCLMPHCEHCGAPQHDDEMYGERHGGLLIFDETDAARVTLHEVAERFEGTYCGNQYDFRYTVEPELIGLMRKVHVR